MRAVSFLANCTVDDFRIILERRNWSVNNIKSRVGNSNNSRITFETTVQLGDDELRWKMVLQTNTIVAVIKTNGVTFEITNTATPDFIKNIIEKFSTNINRNEHNLQKWRFMFNNVFTKRMIRKIMKERK